MRLQAMVIGIFLLVSCRGSSDPEFWTDAQFRTGAQGLVLSFVDGAPPDKSYENEPMIIAVNLKNEGASDIEDGYLLVNLEDDFIDFQSSKGNAFSLSGKSLKNPYGGEEYVEFEGYTKPIVTSSKQDSTLSIMACYTYQTIVRDTLCVDPRIAKTEIVQDSCTPKDISLSSQGGPVAVTKIQPKARPGYGGMVVLQLTIHLQHVGGGYVSAPVDAYSLCSSVDIEHRIFNRVRVRGHLGEFPLQCKRNGLVELKAGSAEVICEVEAYEQARAYTTPLEIILDYSYTQSIQHTLSIEKAK